MSVAATRPGSASLSAHQWTVDQRLEGSRSVEHVDLSASLPQWNTRPSEPTSPVALRRTSPTQGKVRAPPLFRILATFSVFKIVCTVKN